MLTNDSDYETSNGEVFVNPVQEKPNRSEIYSIYKCEDQVIGFEFVTNNLVPTYTNFCNKVAVSLCVPIAVLQSIDIQEAVFLATDDPCFKDNQINKVDPPSIEIQRDDNNLATGILVRFFKDETCCLPVQLSFRLYVKDQNDCIFNVSNGLLLLK